MSHIVEMEDDLIDTIYSDLGLTEGVSKDFIRESLQNIVLFDKKQRDYGPKNISDFGELGLLIRISDKITRIHNLLEKGAARNADLGIPENESLLDSWRDISVYAAIGVLLELDLWPIRPTPFKI